MIEKPTAPEITRKEFCGSDDVIKSHPAFGLVSFTRTSGSNKRLFGSEITSGQTIRLSVSQAKEHWHLHEKRYSDQGLPLIEVEITPSQFAELITTMNIGSGVPCTIRYIGGQEVPDFKDDSRVDEVIKEDLKADCRDISDKLRILDKELKEILASTSLSKVKQQQLTSIVERIRQAVDSNMPFVVEQYTEAVDKITASAKAEMEAYVTHTITSLGLKSLDQLVQAKAEAITDTKE